MGVSTETQVVRVQFPRFFPQIVSRKTNSYKSLQIFIPGLGVMVPWCMGFFMFFMFGCFLYITSVKSIFVKVTESKRLENLP